MKTPTVPSGSTVTAFIDWLQQQSQVEGQMLVVDLFTIALINGPTLYYTSYDQAIAWNGQTWMPGPPYITRQTTSSTVGLETATHQVTFALPSATAGTPSIPIALANSNFQNGATGWSFGTGWAATASGTGGAYSTGGSGYYALYTKGTTSAVTNNQQIPCLAGTILSASCFVEGFAGAKGQAYLRIFWYNSAGTFISESNGPNATANAGYQQNTATGTAPAGTAYAMVSFAVANETAADWAVSGFSVLMAPAGDIQPTVGGFPMMQAFLQKRFNLAQYTYQWLYSAGPGQAWQGAVTMFGGQISSIDEISRAKVQFTVKSVGDQLSAQYPVQLMQADCANTLFDVNCGLTAATYAVNSSATANSTTNTIKCSLTQAAGYFDQGYIEFTSGALTGLKKMVRTYTPGSFAMANPWPVAPAVGDTFVAYPGCDKLMATCQGTKTGSFQKLYSINNLQNFQGQPFVPAPETSY